MLRHKNMLPLCGCGRGILVRLRQHLNNGVHTSFAYQDQHRRADYQHKRLAVLAKRRSVRSLSQTKQRSLWLRLDRTKIGAPVCHLGVRGGIDGGIPKQVSYLTAASANPRLPTLLRIPNTSTASAPSHDDPYSTIHSSH